MIADAFADLDRRQRSHALTSRLLRDFHDALGARVPERSAVLAAQLNSSHPGVRTDGLRMSAELMKSWRGDHTPLITLIGGQLGDSSNEVAAEAAAVLGDCHPIAGAARAALARQVAAHRAAHGPDVWTAPQPQLRRAHQQAVITLACLGDERARPSLLVAFDSGTDTGRAIRPAGFLRPASWQLAPRITAYLSRLDLAAPWAQTTTGPALHALARLGNPAALPAITETLDAALRQESRRVAGAALDALGTFGPAAAAALAAVRPLAAGNDPVVRPAAVAALWAISRDQDEVLLLAAGLLRNGNDFQVMKAADILGEIGAPAAAALPRLRELLGHSYEWVRVHAAAALWDIAGAAEAPAVLTAAAAWWPGHGYVPVRGFQDRFAKCYET